MRIKFELTAHDLLAINEREARANRWIRCFMVLVIVGAVVVPLVMANPTNLSARNWLSLAVLLSPLAALIPFFWFYFPLTRGRDESRQLRQLAKVESEYRFGTRWLEISASGIIDAGSDITYYEGWVRIDRIEDREHHTLFFTAPGQALVLPKQRIIEGVAEPFVEEARRLHGAYRLREEAEA